MADHSHQRHAQIEKMSKDVSDGGRSLLDMILKLFQHSDHMLNNLRSLMHEPSFLQVYSCVNSALANYMTAFTTMKCNLELLVLSEISKWNSICIVDESVGMNMFDNHDYLKNVMYLNSSQHGHNNSIEVEESNTTVGENVDVKSFQGKNEKESVEEDVRDSANATISQVNTNTEECDKESEMNHKSLQTICDKEKSQQVCTEFGSLVSVDRIKTLNEVFTPNRKYKGTVTFVTSSELYVKFLTEETLLMNDSLWCDMEMFLEMDSPKVLPVVQFGVYAMHVQAKDRSFAIHRVETVEPISHDDKVSVFLLDSGQTEDVSPEDLYEMPEYLLHYPALATRCHLSGVTPPASALGRIRDWVERNVDVVIIVKEGNASVSVPVELYNSTETESLNRVLMEAEEEEEEERSDWDPMMEDFKSTKNTYDLDVNDPAFAIYGYVGRDYARTCKEFGETGKCFKGDSCRKEHVLFDPSGYTTDKEDVYMTSFNRLSLPSPEDEVDVVVTSVVSTTKFYCKLGRKSDYGCEGDETLASLLGCMNDGKAISRHKKLSTPPSVGQIVIGRVQKKKPWRRGRVVDVLPEKEECTLFFVDDGETEMVKLRHVRAIDPCYLHLPFQAVLCELDSFGDVGKDGRHHIEQGARIRVIGVVSEERPHLVVKLYDEDGRDIAEALARENFVTPRENLIVDEGEMALPG